MLCDAMKWNHLPMAGGLYDQNPDLLDHFHYIFAMKSREEERRRAESERKSSSGGANRRMGRGGSRR